MENEFEKMYGTNTEEVNVDYNLDTTETEEQEQKPVNEETEMTPGDFSNYTWLKNPEVGESITIEIDKIIRRPSKQFKNPEDGKMFWTGLEDKNKKKEETILQAPNGDRLSISSWSLYFALFGKDSEFQKIANTTKTYKGIKLKITHVYNGKDSTTNTKDLMKLRDFKTEAEAEEHKKIVAKALKEGKIYKVEVLK